MKQHHHINDLLAMLKGRISNELMAQLEDLPGSLTLKLIPYYRAGNSVVEQRRGSFNGMLRSEFLRHVGTTQANALRQMGIDDALIDSMKHEGQLSTHNPQAALCTVDHVLSLNFGGNNDFNNLMLLPKKYNELKNALEMAQFTNDAQSQIITIVPKREGDLVPFIDNGYARTKASAP